MELRVLKYFLMVAREENITRAAALLNITQPTLSRQMIQLEEELGVKLFDRNRHRILLTDDGMLLKRRAQEIVSLADRTEREFQRREDTLTGDFHWLRGNQKYEYPFRLDHRLPEGIPAGSVSDLQRYGGRYQGSDGKGNSGYRSDDGAGGYRKI